MKASAEYQPIGKSWRVRDLPARIRPREEMARLGAGNVSDDVLISILVRSGVRGVSVVDLSRRLLSEYGSLTALARVNEDELASFRGMGRVKAQVLTAAFELAARLSEEVEPGRFQVKTPADVAGLLKDAVRKLEREVFWILMLDSRNGLKGRPQVVSTGILDASLVHPREVFRAAVRAGAAAVVLAHNHPSGDTTPSVEDIKITRQMVQAGAIVDIKVMDHVVVAGKSDDRPHFTSLREEGVVSFS